MIDRSRWNVQYMQHVLATDPIAYWMQDEKQGLVSYDMVTARSSGARNGTYTGPTLGQPGIGDGRTSALFDGALDFDNIFTVSLRDAFDGDEGTILAWAMPVNAGVWTDGVIRRIMTLRANATNEIYFEKGAANNTFRWHYEAGGVSEDVVNVAFSPTDFFSLMITWSAAADEMRAYFNGAQEGATQTVLGAWGGAAVLGATTTVIGAASTVPASVWNGFDAHGAVWGRALPPAEALSLGVL